MDLLIAVLLWLNVCVTPVTINNPEFREANEAQFERARLIIDNNWYSYNEEGGVVVDEDVRW